MKAVTANLKIFYQRPVLYFWYFIILCQVPALIGSSNSDMQNMALFHLIMSMLFGLLIGSTQKEIMCRPVTYCLPGYRGLSHKFIFILGALLTFIPVAVKFKMMMATADNYLLTAMAVWLAGMSVYVLSVWLSFQNEYGENRPCMVGGLWAAVFISIFFYRSPKFWLIFAEMPLFIIAPTLAWVAFFWFYLGKGSHRRNFCGKDVITLFDKWNMQKISGRRIARAAGRKKTPSRISILLESFITGKMKTCLEWKNKTALGFIYTSFDRILITSLVEMFPLVLIILILGYIFGMVQTDIRGDLERSTFMLDIFYIMPVMGALMHMFPSHPTLHIPANRKEKFYASIVNGIFVVIFAMVFVGAAVGFANIIQPYMPAVPGRIFHPEAPNMPFAAPKLSHIYIIPMLMPLGFIASILIKGRQSIMIIAGPVIFISSWFYMMSHSFANNLHIAIPIISTVSWLGFIAVLRWHCMKRNLV